MRASGTWPERGTVLLIGADGQLGGELLAALTAHGSPCRAAARHPPRADWLAVDLADPGATAALVSAERPAVVINAAAYTAVDRAEDEPRQAMAVNAHAPGVLAQACRDIGALLVHFSTDYVFDGASARPYVETDRPAPLSQYGRSKAAGEEAVLRSGCAHLVFRTSWLYTPGGHNFVATMLRLFQGSEPVRVVDDQHGCPTWARPLAEAVAGLLAERDARTLEAHRGLYHLCAAGATSWHGFAAAIRARARPPARAPLYPIRSAEYPVAARRPARSVLCCDRARERLGLALPGWLEQLDGAMPEFNAARADAH